MAKPYQRSVNASNKSVQKLKKVEEQQKDKTIGKYRAFCESPGRKEVNSAEQSIATDVNNFLTDIIDKFYIR